MDDGFMVRVVAQTDREARNVKEVANAVRREGLDAHATMLHQISLQLSLLSEQVAGGNATVARVAEVTHDLHRGLLHAASQMHAASGGASSGAPVRLARIACDLEKSAKVLAKINWDALGETQPIWPKPRRS